MAHEDTTSPADWGAIYLTVNLTFSPGYVSSIGYRVFSAVLFRPLMIILTYWNHFFIKVMNLVGNGMSFLGFISDLPLSLMNLRNDGFCSLKNLFFQTMHPSLMTSHIAVITSPLLQTSSSNSEKTYFDLSYVLNICSILSTRFVGEEKVEIVTFIPL